MKTGQVAPEQEPCRAPRITYNNADPRRVEESLSELLMNSNLLWRRRALPVRDGQRSSSDSRLFRV